VDKKQHDLSQNNLFMECLPSGSQGLQSPERLALSGSVSAWAPFISRLKVKKT